MFAGDTQSHALNAACVRCRFVLLGAGLRPSKKQHPERLSELSTHGAVEDKVDGAVDEDDHVEHVAERDVDVVEEAIVDAAEEGEDALRQLGGHEAEHDGDEHGRRAGVLSVTVGLVPASRRPQAAALGGRAPHRRHEQAAQHGQQDARSHLEDDAEQPEVDGGHRFREESGRVEPVVDRCWGRRLAAGSGHCRHLLGRRGVGCALSRQRYNLVLDVVRRTEDRSRNEDGCYCHLNVQHTIVYGTRTVSYLSTLKAHLEESVHTKVPRLYFLPVTKPMFDTRQ